MKKKIINILEQHSVYRRVEEESFKEVAEQIVSEIKTYTEEDLRLAFRAGVLKGGHQSYFDTPLDEDEYIESLNTQPKEEDEIPITYGLIKATCGWSKFCDVTGGNHYAIDEWGDFRDSEVFYCTRSQAIELGIIKE